jgi:predicted transcriptional regulator
MLPTDIAALFKGVGTGGQMSEDNTLNAVELATELTIAWLGNANTRVSAEDVPAFLRTMHTTVTELSVAKPAEPEAAPEETAAEEFTPAVTVRKSLASKDHILSLIDGKPYKTLRRHLGTHGLTPEQYRQRYKLKADYPMVAESYSEARRAMAHKIGLGSKGRAAKVAATAPAPVVKAKRAPRRKAADA